MVTLFFFLITIFQLTTCFEQSFISLPYHRHYLNDYIQLHSKQSSLTYKCTVDLTSSNSWYLEDETDSHNAITNGLKSERRLLSTRNGLFQGEYVNKTFSFEEHHDNISGLPIFYLIKPEDIVMNEYPKCVLGLGHSTKEEKYSLLQELKVKGQITHASFGISFPNFRVFLGGLPLEFRNKDHSNCNIINKSDPRWNCKLLFITYKNKSIEYKYKTTNETSFVIFSSDNNITQVPEHFFSYMIDTIFHEMIMAHVCFISKGISHERLLYCDPNDFIKKGNVTFVIEDFSYTILFEQFWACLKFFCYFSFKENKDGNYWMLGSDFYYKYTILFDDEEQKIHFYSDQGVKSFSLTPVSDTNEFKSNRLLKLILITIMIISSIGIGLSMIIKKKRSNSLDVLLII